MFFLDYLLFDEKGKFKFYSPMLWLSFPLIYIILTQVRGKFGGNIDGTNSSYTYPILDPTPNGIGNQFYIFAGGIFFSFSYLDI